MGLWFFWLGYVVEIFQEHLVRLFIRAPGVVGCAAPEPGDLAGCLPRVGRRDYLEIVRNS